MAKQLSLLPTKESPTECEIEIFIDGASRSNPGPSGAGIYMKKDKKVKGYSFFLGIKTNNQAEYLALVLGLLQIQPPASVSIVSDSLLLVKQIKGEYRVKNNNIQNLYYFAIKLLEKFDYKIKHVLREKNKEADKLANIAVDKKVEIPNDIKAALLEAGIEI